MGYVAILDGIDRGSGFARDALAAIFQDIEERLAAYESATATVAALRERLEADGAAIVDGVAGPLIARLRAAADLGVVFTASSTSPAEPGLGQKSFVVAGADRLAFAPAARLTITAADAPEVAMFARKLSYASDTGLLTVEVTEAQGAGLYASWQISPGALTSAAAGLGAAPPAGFSGVTVQALLVELAHAVKNDPNWSDKVDLALAARVTQSALNAVLGTKANRSDALTLLGGLVPATSRIPAFTAANGAALLPYGQAGLEALGAADGAALRQAAGLVGGSWEPAVSFAVNGDFAPTYLAREGAFVRMGGMVFVSALVQFDTNAYTGASGAFRISGLPFVPSGPFGLQFGPNLAKLVWSEALTFPVILANLIQFRATSSGGIAANLSTGFVPPATQGVSIAVSGVYATNAA